MASLAAMRSSACAWLCLPTLRRHVLVAVIGLSCVPRAPHTVRREDVVASSRDGGPLPSASAGQIVNLALGKPYELEPEPNYKGCTDAGDRVQLTDGEEARGIGPLWVRVGAVGWKEQRPTITIDLGKTEPIAGLWYHTAAGSAGVHFPTGIRILVSDDGIVWHAAGDLVALSDSPPDAGSHSGYREYRYGTMRLATHGRYVKVLVLPSGIYSFVDEIEVDRGPDALLRDPFQGLTVTNVKEYAARAQIEAPLRRRLLADVAAVSASLKVAGTEDAGDSRFALELNAILQEIPSVEVPDPARFTTVFPINDLHRRIFAVQSGIWQASGLHGIVPWQTGRWDMLSPTAMPTTDGVSVDVAMMSDEFRSAAFNLSNAGDVDAPVTMVLEDLPSGPNPSYVAVYEVPFTDTQSGLPVAAALLPLRQEAGRYVTRIPPGLTRQIWMTFHPKAMAAGDYRGHFVIDSGGANGPDGATESSGKSVAVPIHLKVYPFALPARPALHLSGWDYTDGDKSYDVTPENRDALIRELQDHFVDSPWADEETLPLGKYDSDGKMVQAPDPGRFRDWATRWPGARGYYVFVNVAESFAGFTTGTLPFTRAVSDWITWWVDQLGRWDIGPDRLGLLLVDEPMTSEEDRLVVEYANVIHAAQPKVVVWEDPARSDPSAGSAEIFRVSTVLSTGLNAWIDGGHSFADWYLDLRNRDHRLWFYSAKQTGRLLDPYSYYRLPPWYCWKYGAEGSAFWAFGSAGGSSSWNEYSAVGSAFTPLFLDPKSVTTGKHMEAIREGMEDYEYLRMLGDRVEALEKQGGRSDVLVRARRLLDSAPDRVIAGATSQTWPWSAPKDRSVADSVRVEILEALASLLVTP